MNATKNYILVGITLIPMIIFLILIASEARIIPYLEQNNKIPFIAVGSDELGDEKFDRLNELLRSGKEVDTVKALSLAISKGGSENGQVRHCSNNCEKIYIVFPDDESRICKCGGTIKF